MKRVLIVNKESGQLSALPSLEEYKANDFVSEGMITGIVEVSEEVLVAVYAERNHVRVLMPELPKPDQEGGWSYVAVLKGHLKLI